MEAAILQFLLVTYFSVAFVGAVFYLRHRRAILVDYIIWGTVALAIPVLGPFLVIAARPGPRKHTRRLHSKNGSAKLP